MSEYNLFLGVTEELEFPPAVIRALRYQLGIQDLGMSTNTAGRNALDTNLLAGGFFIWNTDVNGYQVWRSDFEEWHDGLESPGSQKWWPGPTIPAGWKKHDGALLPRTTYWALFKAIGTTYGGSDTPTHFKLPLTGGRGLIDANASYALGAKGGAEKVKLDAVHMPRHSHAGTTNGRYIEHRHSGNTDSAGVHTHGYDWITNGSFNATGQGENPVYRGSRNVAQTGDAGNHYHQFLTSYDGQTHDHDFTTNEAGGDTAHDNMSPYIAGHFIIKY